MPPSSGTARDYWREDEPRHPALALPTISGICHPALALPGIIGACGPCTERVDAGTLPPHELLLCQVGASYVLYDMPPLWAFGGTPRFCW